MYIMEMHIFYICSDRNIILITQTLWWSWYLRYKDHQREICFEVYEYLISYICIYTWPILTRVNLLNTASFVHFLYSVLNHYQTLTSLTKKSQIWHSVHTICWMLSRYLLFHGVKSQSSSPTITGIMLLGLLW